MKFIKIFNIQLKIWFSYFYSTILQKLFSQTIKNKFDIISHVSTMQNTNRLVIINRNKKYIYIQKHYRKPTNNE